MMEGDELCTRCFSGGCGQMPRAEHTWHLMFCPKDETAHGCHQTLAGDAGFERKAQVEGTA